MDRDLSGRVVDILMPKQPIVWDDALGPAFALGPGGTAPTIGTFVGVIRLLTFDPGDYLDFAIQFPHDVHIPASGNVTFRPHVHWTCVSEPDTGDTVIWEIAWLYAKVEAQYAGTVNTLTGPTYTCSDGATELRKHIVTSLGDITVPAADVGPSGIMIGRLILKSTSTINNDVPALLSFDIHYQKGPIGTDGEFA